MTTYTITAGVHHLRESMRTATSHNVESVLRVACQYLGHVVDRVQTLDGGDIYAYDAEGEEIPVYARRCCA